MKKHLLLLFVLILSLSCYAQGEANIWYFGRNAGLDFNSGNPISLNDGQLSTEEGCATISNSNGNLLFYTDGITVWNKNHQIMPNGIGLLGDPSSAQSAIIVPKPNSSTIYYVFTTPSVGNTLIGACFSEVDMSNWFYQTGRTYQEGLDLLKNQYNNEYFLHHKFKSQLAPTEDEIIAYYDDNP